MNLPSYPGQPQPEEPKQPDVPAQPVTPPPPPVPPTPPPAAPPAPAYPGGFGTPPPPAPPGAPFPPVPPGGGYPTAYQAYAGPNDGSAGYSGLAIASFVCSLTCCLGIPAVVLGAIGIAKTGAGRARGRWMAVTGVVLGVLGTLLLIVVGLGLFALGDRIVTPGNAEAGQCVQATTDGDTVTMLDLGCSVEHNAQIFAVITPTQADVEADRTQMQLCLTRVAGSFPGVEVRAVDGAPRLTLRGDQVEVGAASTHSRLEPGSPVACWVEATDGVLDADVVD